MTTESTLRAALELADACISAAFEGTHFDGGDIQEMAERLGLIAPEIKTESCGEHCSCAEVDSFPQTCYRKTYLAALAATPPTEQPEFRRYPADMICAECGHEFGHHNGMNCVSFNGKFILDDEKNTLGSKGVAENPPLLPSILD